MMKEVGMARKQKNNASVSEKVDKPKTRRTTTATLRKEIDALRASNQKLLVEIGKMSELYMNTLSNNAKESAAHERIAATQVAKRVCAFLLQTYGLKAAEILK